MSIPKLKSPMYTPSEKDLRIHQIVYSLRDMGYNVVSAEAEQVPSTYTTLTDEEHIKKMNLLLETLDDNDDVQNVWHNWDMD